VKHWSYTLLILTSSIFFNKIGAQWMPTTQGNFDPPPKAPIVVARKLSTGLQIDGKLREAVWDSVVATSEFFRMEPRQGGAISYPSYVKVLFDDKNLYFGVYCKDTSGKKSIRVQDLRRDFIYGENDIFYIQLDPQNLQRFCVSFQTTPYGNQRDLQVFDDSYRDNDWDALWKVRTNITDSGYTAEFVIPFVSLRYTIPKNSDSVSWGITFARLARKEYEQSVFPAIPQTFSPYRMNYAAQLKGLQLPPPAINLRVQPYSLYQFNRNTNAANSKNSSQSIKFGGEIKWAINPRSVVDFTVNTDFAQADVDRAVNNLTRFNVFFPERRQFFLENSGVYAGADIDGIKPFFSRAIGLANTQFNADPVAIDAGLRYTDRTQARTIAGLYVHQRGNDNQSAANFGVFRYLKNYGVQNNVGVMFTHRLDEKNPINGFAAKHNTTVTIDGLVRPTNSFTVQYLASASRNNKPDSIGMAAYLFVGYEPQNMYLGWLSKYVDEKYVPGMGFVFANNTIHHNPGGYYIWRPKGKLGKLIRRMDPGGFVNWYQNANDWKTQEFSLYIFPIYIITATNGQIEYAAFPTWQNFNFSFPILGRPVAIGEYQYTRHLLRYRTDRSRKFSVETKYEFGGYYNGSLNTTTIDARYAPLPHIAITSNYEHNNFKQFGINRDNFVTELYTAGIRLAYNPRIQLSGFYQYNTFDSKGRWNIRGSWEFAPLSFFYFVFNETNFRHSPINNQSVITKLTYLKQF
jgi:hypothetical protein